MASAFLCGGCGGSGKPAVRFSGCLKRGGASEKQKTAFQAA